MKAGLLTFHSAHHYGAQLQAYALMKAVMRCGVDCEIINYIRDDAIEGKKLFKKGLSLRTFLSNAHTLLNYRPLKRRYERFESFINDGMKLSEKLYRSYEELAGDAPLYDVYICGSDQIWNPVIFGEKIFDPAFFAEFAKSGRRIAYAPSFGITEIPEVNREALNKYLGSFESLSVREKHGEKIIRDVAARESVTVLDPTLLLAGDEWDNVLSAPLYREPYILCYFISDPSSYSGFVKTISQKYKLPVISLCGARRVVSNTSHAVLDAGPKEFLSLFRNASFVCTNSFHGTVFSINFKKDFISFSKSLDAEKTVNSRISNILERLGLVSGIFMADTDMQDFRRRIDGMDLVDYAKVDGLLKKEREMSMDYLKKALWKR